MDPNVHSVQELWRIYLKHLFFVLVTSLLCAALSGCASLPPPSTPNNLCTIFKNRPNWYESAYKSSKRWKVPIQVMMAIMKQESSFRANAQPPRPWFLFIPLPRTSSAYGYPQAQDPVWDEYKKEASNSWLPSRSNFGDSIDFIGWYIRKTQRLNKVSPWRADEIYLNYHEGWGGYRRGSWKKKRWLVGVAKKVERNASTYGWQLKHCSLPSPGWSLW